MLDRKWVRRWVVVANSLVVLLLGFTAYNGYRQTEQLRRVLSAPPVPAHQLLKNYFPLVCIAILLLTGIAVEVKSWKWAWVINAAFYWFIFLPSLWQSIAAYPGPHPDGVMVGIILIVVPSGTIAIITSVLYLAYFRSHASRLHPNAAAQLERPTPPFLHSRAFPDLHVVRYIYGQGYSVLQRPNRHPEANPGRSQSHRGFQADSGSPGAGDCAFQGRCLEKAQGRCR